MTDLMEFNSYTPRSKRKYGGANGVKIGILIENEPYLLKIYKNVSTWNGKNLCFSEYIGCKIFESYGMTAQQTILGEYITDQGDVYPAIACKDFCTEGYQLSEFFKTKNSILESSENGNGTELNNILLAINEQQDLDSNLLSNFFWDQFIVDALIGNYDRHNGNWGFLENENNMDCKISPIYDCGSSLFAKLGKEVWENALKNASGGIAYICKNSFSAIKNEDKTPIVYSKFLNNCLYNDCIEALSRYESKSNLLNTYLDIIEKTPGLDNFRKDFYSKVIDYRHNQILLGATNKLETLTNDNNIDYLKMYYFRLNNILNEVVEPIDSELSIKYKQRYKQLLQNSINQKAVGTANLDAVVVSELQTKQNKKELQQIIYDFSPNCFDDQNYVQKVMCKAKAIINNSEKIKNNIFLKRR